MGVIMWSLASRPSRCSSVSMASTSIYTYNSFALQRWQKWYRSRTERASWSIRPECIGMAHSSTQIIIQHNIKKYCCRGNNLNPKFQPRKSLYGTKFISPTIVKSPIMNLNWMTFSYLTTTTIRIYEIKWIWCRPINWRSCPSVNATSSFDTESFNRNYNKSNAKRRRWKVRPRRKMNDPAPLPLSPSPFSRSSSPFYLFSCRTNRRARNANPKKAAKKATSMPHQP